jgi:hypothetical protein
MITELKEGWILCREFTCRQAENQDYRNMAENVFEGTVHLLKILKLLITGLIKKQITDGIASISENIY